MKKPTGAKPSAGNHHKPSYIPDVGDLVWLMFSPQTGREQAGRRPALVLSPKSYNAKAGLCLLCPITSHAKGYPFEVPMPDGSAVHGVILCDHLKSADWQERKIEAIGLAAATILDEVRAKLKPLLGI